MTTEPSEPFCRYQPHGRVDLLSNHVSRHTYNAKELDPNKISSAGRVIL